jgi:hypothetical protein
MLHMRNSVHFFRLIPVTIFLTAFAFSFLMGTAAIWGPRLLATLVAQDDTKLECGISLAPTAQVISQDDSRERGEERSAKCERRDFLTS